MILSKEKVIFIVTIMAITALFYEAKFIAYIKPSQGKIDNR